MVTRVGLGVVRISGSDSGTLLSPTGETARSLRTAAHHSAVYDHFRVEFRFPGFADTALATVVRGVRADGDRGERDYADGLFARGFHLVCEAPRSGFVAGDGGIRHRRNRISASRAVADR